MSDELAGELAGVSTDQIAGEMAARLSIPLFSEWRVTWVGGADPVAGVNGPFDTQARARDRAARLVEHGLIGVQVQHRQVTEWVAQPRGGSR